MSNFVFLLWLKINFIHSNSIRTFYIIKDIQNIQHNYIFNNDTHLETEYEYVDDGETEIDEEDIRIVNGYCTCWWNKIYVISTAKFCN